MFVGRGDLLDIIVGAIRQPDRRGITCGSPINTRSPSWPAEAQALAGTLFTPIPLATCGASPLPLCCLPSQGRDTVFLNRGPDDRALMAPDYPSCATLKRPG